MGTDFGLGGATQAFSTARILSVHSATTHGFQSKIAGWAMTDSKRMLDKMWLLEAPTAQEVKVL